MITRKAHGKINLTLEIMGRHKDGYHEIKSLMQKVELGDTLSFQHNQDKKIRLRGNVSTIPYDDGNLVVKAAKLLQERAGIFLGAEIYLEKVLPVEAGMAGGSADAAATLLGLNELWNLQYPLEELMDLGSKLGSDIPYCLQEGTALVQGRGERLSQVSGPKKLPILIVKPNFGVSTKLIYEGYDNEKGKKNIKEDASSTDAMLNALKGGNRFFEYLHNDLQPITTTLFPEVSSILRRMKEGGGEALMSGSGPTCFCFGEEEQLNALYDEFSKKYRDVYITRLY